MLGFFDPRREVIRMRRDDSSPADARARLPPAAFAARGARTIWAMSDRDTRAEHSSLVDRMGQTRVLVCLGPGGVGKTTISAALGLGLAARGRRVVVVPIDPAQRLASALGLAQLSGEPHRVELERLQLEVGGELWAMTLDVKGTFDGLIARLAPQQGARRRILDNRVYRELSSAVAGSQELSALMKLYELERERRFDVIVLDTPPSRNAVDFLRTPTRLRRFLDSRALGLFLTPGGLTARLLGRGSTVILAVFSRVTGVEVIGELSEFFGSLEGTIDGFRERAEAVERLLRDRSATAFLIVSSPESHPAREAVFLAQELDRARMARAGLIVNRVERAGLDGHAPQELEELLTPELGPRLARLLTRNLIDFDVLAARDQRNISRLAASIGEDEPILVPRLDHDIQDLAGLALLVELLFD
jgi:anion-transporting  ArsA/GET3 family ATPase